tara:strand:+ start:256 stop:618 length:363 start_codon:yes stop_codon:yes gene_type:complete
MGTVHNPQTFLNGYISMTRNMFTISAVGLSAMTFADSFNTYKKIVKIIALMIIIISILYGIKASYDFNRYLKYLESSDELKDPYKFLIDDWRDWIKLTYIYIIVSIILAFIIMFRKIRFL